MAADNEFEREFAKFLQDAYDVQSFAKLLRRSGFAIEYIDSATAEDKFKDVYPDIIVHDRAGLGAEHNLLVVEVKKKERDGHAADIAKLRGFLASPLCYQRAVFVVLPKDVGMPRCLPIS